MFALCKTCADTGNESPCTHFDVERAIQRTWCSVELMKESVRKRLSDRSNARIVAFPAKKDTLFKEYIDTFANGTGNGTGILKRC